MTLDGATTTMRGSLQGVGAVRSAQERGPGLDLSLHSPSSTESGCAWQAGKHCPLLLELQFKTVTEDLGRAVRE